MTHACHSLGFVLVAFHIYLQISLLVNVSRQYSKQLTKKILLHTHGKNYNLLFNVIKIP